MLLKIGDAAKKLGLTPRAIRHYEDIGLIKPHTVLESNYRLYSQRELVLLDCIGALAKLGIPLAQIKQLLSKSNEDKASDGKQVRQLLALQLQMVERNISKLQEIRDVIRQADFTLELNEDKPLELVRSIALTLEKNRVALEQWQDKWDFDHQAQSYDDVTGRTGLGYDPHENYQGVLSFVAQLAQGAELVLDAGIGTGNLAQELLKAGCKVIGLDQSREMLRKAKEKLPQVELLEGNVLALPLADHAVNAVASTYVLHHLEDDAKLLALTEMIRVLQPGGRIIIGDNMFFDVTAREQECLRLLNSGQHEDWEAIEDEHLANVVLIAEYLHKQGLKVEYSQLATYTWVVWAQV